jgi:two-component system, NarL family, sensor kinase
MSADILSGIAAGSIFMLLIALFAIILVIRYRQKEYQNKKQISQIQNNFRQELLTAQVEIKEQTLKNVAQEIHDNIGQTLSLAKLNLNTIEPNRQNGWAEKITDSKELVGKAIHDLRHLSKSLNTDSILASGIVNAIRSELAIVERAGSFGTALNISGTTVRLDAKKELILFRITQEAINNIIKHAEASFVNVNLIFTEDRLHLNICDNGKGFMVKETDTDGSGLRNMESRAVLIGGNFKIETDNGGTTISVTLPIH